MPRVITKDEALARLSRAPLPECVPCALAASPALAANEHARAVLTRYPVRWGHVLVVLARHVTRMTDTRPEEWAAASLLAREAAIAIEAALAPPRCYVAALGTSQAGLPMSFPHLHLHVLPVPEPGARPREVLTWQGGVYVGTDEEWAELSARLRSAWP